MTARDKFRTSPHGKEWQKIVADPAFETALDAALLELLSLMPGADNPAKGWDSHSQMVGARRFSDILKTLHEPPKEQKARTGESLNYLAGV